MLSALRRAGLQDGRLPARWMAAWVAANWVHSLGLFLFGIWLQVRVGENANVAYGLIACALVAWGLEAAGVRSFSAPLDRQAKAGVTIGIVLAGASFVALEVFHGWP